MVRLKFYVGVIFQDNQYIAYSPDFNQIFPIGDTYDETTLYFAGQVHMTAWLKLPEYKQLLYSPHTGYLLAINKTKQYARVHRVSVDDVIEVKDVIVTMEV